MGGGGECVHETSGERASGGLLERRQSSDVRRQRRHFFSGLCLSKAPFSRHEPHQPHRECRSSSIVTAGQLCLTVGGSEWSAHARGGLHRSSRSMLGSEDRLVHQRTALVFTDAIAIRSSDKAENDRRGARVFHIALASRKQQLAFPMATTYDHGAKRRTTTRHRRKGI